jgi:ATP-dependent helicase/nuclease subunit A
VRVLATPTFIRTTLLSCRWHQTILEDARRDQQLANIEKLIALINDASRRGMASIRDVIQSITVPEKDKEAEELYDVGGDSVRIMTIHSSKGLDFPVVVLAGIHGKGGGNDTTFGNSDAVGPTLGIAAKVPQSTPPFALASRGILLSHAVNTSLQQQRDVAEDRRLLYVALTRAEDHVLVSIPYALTKNGELGAADGVGRVLRPFFHDRTALTDVDDQGWLLSYHQQMYANEQETTHLMHVRVPAILPDNVLCVIDRSRDGIPAGGNEIPPDVLDLSASLVDCVSLDMVSATEVLAASLRNEEPSAATVDADVDETRGAAYGTLVHYLLQQGARLQGTLDASALRDQLFDRLGSRDVSDMVRTAAVSEVMAVLHAPFLQTMSDALRNAALETSLTAVLNGVTIYGVMDVLLQGEDGCAEIWDWKTTSVHDRSDVTAAAASYQEQMQVYAWLLLMSDPTIDQVRTRLLFTKAIGVTDEWMVTQTWTREGLENVTTSLRSAIAGIKQRRATRAGLIVDSD